VKNLSKEDRAFYVQELRGNECACGQIKSPGHSFCHRCYFQLPLEMKQSLYSKMGQGYEEVYEAAVKYLGV